MNTEFNVGVIVGRFQVAELHSEHIRLIDSVLQKHQKVIIFLGISPFKTTKNNPLDFESRKSLIENKYGDRVIVLFLSDCRENKEWSNNLDYQIGLVTSPADKVLLYGGRDSFVISYSGKYPTTELKPERYISGNDCRKNLGESIKKSSDFRAGVIWATQNQYTRVMPTVDITVIIPTVDKVRNFNPQTMEEWFSYPIIDCKILLARKPGEDKLRFIGGFVETGCDNLEDEAVRELAEEGGLTIPAKSLNYICSHNVRDWRVSGEKERIVTTFFAAKLESEPEIKAGDDISWCKFIYLSSLISDDFVNGHKILFEKLKEKINKIASY